MERLPERVRLPLDLLVHGCDAVEGDDRIRGQESWRIHLGGQDAVNPLLIALE